MRDPVANADLTSHAASPPLPGKSSNQQPGLPIWLYWLSLALTFGAAVYVRFQRAGPVTGLLSPSYLVKAFRLGGLPETQALEAARVLAEQDTAAASAEALYGYQTVAAHPVYPLIGAPLARLFGTWGLQALTLTAALVLAFVIAKVALARYGPAIALGVTVLGLVGSGWLTATLAVGPDALGALLAGATFMAVWLERTKPSRRLLILTGAGAFLVCLTAPMVLVLLAALAGCYLASALRWRTWRVAWWRGLLATMLGTAAANTLQLALWPDSGIFSQLARATGATGSDVAGASPGLVAAVARQQGLQLFAKPGAGAVLTAAGLVGLIFCWRSIEARLAAAAAIATQVYALLAGQFTQGPWVLALIPVLALIARLATQLHTARRATQAYWSVIGGSFVLQFVAAARYHALFVPDSRHYWAMALRFGGLPRDQVAETLCGPNQPYGCLPIERLLDWDLVRPRFVYPALATPFVKLWGQFGLGLVSVIAAITFFAVTGWYLAQRFGRPVALLTLTLALASVNWFFFLVMMATESLSSLWAALMLVAAWCYVRQPRRRYLVWLAVLVILSTFTRQAVLVPAMAFGLALVGQWIVTRRWRTPFTAPGALVAGLGLVMQVIQLKAWPDVSQDGLDYAQAEGLGGWLREFLRSAWHVTGFETGRAAVNDRVLMVLGLLTVIAALSRLRQVESQLALGGLLAGWLYLTANASGTTGLRYFEPGLVFMLAALAGLFRPVPWPDTAAELDMRTLEHV